MREKIPSSNRRPAQRVYTCGDKKGGKVCVYEVCAMQRKCETQARRGDDQIWHGWRLEDVTKWNHEENGFSGMSVEFWDAFCIQGRVSKHCGYFRLTQKDISSYCDFSFLAFSIKCKKRMKSEKYLASSLWHKLTFHGSWRHKWFQQQPWATQTSACVLRGGPVHAGSTWIKMKIQIRSS